MAQSATKPGCLRQPGNSLTLEMSTRLAAPDHSRSRLDGGFHTHSSSSPRATNERSQPLFSKSLQLTHLQLKTLIAHTYWLVIYFKPGECGPSKPKAALESCSRPRSGELRRIATPGARREVFETTVAASESSTATLYAKHSYRQHDAA
jgi:hypothetical protein